MRPILKNFLTLNYLFAAVFCTQAAFAQQITDQFAPETATALEEKADRKTLSSKKWMVSVANPHAAEAAAKILRDGGNAADAAIAAQLVLGLVEPQSSGLGGGAFLVYFDAKSGKLTTLDGRETAPIRATAKLFQKPDGTPMGFFDAVIGGRSVGTPGTPALLVKMSQKWGALPWQDLFVPALKLSTDGFKVSPRLASLLSANQKYLGKQKAARELFLPDGKPRAAGSRFINTQYHNTLQQFAQQGRKAFYSGKIANDIAKTVQDYTANPGLLSLADFSAYKVIERQPVCSSYRGKQICGMGPPSSGALTVGQILGILEPYNLQNLGPTSPRSWKLIGDASRLAFADRGRYMADSDFVKMPTKGLIDPKYLKERSKLLQLDNALPTPTAGEPSWEEARLPRADDESLELPSTTHFSIVDQFGNVVSMTSTIENGFGSRLATNGFLLNNELTDFSFRDQKNGKPIANSVEPGKRPRSSMAPTIVMENGKPVFVVGSPGGSRIIPYVAKTIIAHLDWGMDVQSAISTPHLVNRFGTYDLERGTSAEKLAPALKKLGYKVKIRSLNSGIHAIAINDDELRGGADHRREGVVLGE